MMKTFVASAIYLPLVWVTETGRTIEVEWPVREKVGDFLEKNAGTKSDRV